MSVHDLRMTATQARYTATQNEQRCRNWVSCITDQDAGAIAEATSSATLAASDVIAAAILEGLAEIADAIFEASPAGRS